MGNSTGMILPKEVLRQIGAKAGVAMDLAVEGNRVIATPMTRVSRSGWEQAAAQISAVPDDEVGLWAGFANEGDSDLEW